MLERGLADRVPFRVQLVRLGGDYRLEGGSVCHVAGRTVVCTRWKGREGSYALYQFRPEDFGFGARAARGRTMCDCSEGVCSCGAVMWLEGDRGYALVAGGSRPVQPLVDRIVAGP